MAEGPMRYAARTDVPVGRSKDEIEKMLTRHGATAFMAGSDGDRAAVGFVAHGLHVRLVAPLPDRQAREFTHTPTGRRRAVGEAATEADRAVRATWRALALIIKAKLEAEAAGVVTFEEEWLAHVVLPDGHRVGDHAVPAVHQAYQSGQVPDLLGPNTRRAINA